MSAYTISNVFEKHVQSIYEKENYVIGAPLNLKKKMIAMGLIDKSIYCPIPDGFKVNENGSLDIIEIKYRLNGGGGSVDEKFMTANGKIWAWENVHNMKINSYTYICSSFFGEEEKMELYRRYLNSQGIKYIIIDEKQIKECKNFL